MQQKHSSSSENIFYTSSRSVWRTWLLKNYRTQKEVWFVFPMKESGEESLSYNDAVEEALCFGWIDSTIRNIDVTHRAQHFTPRKKGVGELGLILKRIKKWYNGICCVLGAELQCCLVAVTRENTVMDL